MKVYNHWSEFPMDQWRWKNFSPQEMACRGTGKLAIDERSMDMLQALRDELGRPIIINSAFRSPEHNKRVGGASKSYHLRAMAFDCNMTNQEPQKFENAARKVGFKGFGFYRRSRFIHVDSRETEAEWGERWIARELTELPEEAPRQAEKLHQDADLIVGGIGSIGGLGGVGTILTSVSSLDGDAQQIVAMGGMVVAALALIFIVFHRFNRITR